MKVDFGVFDVGWRRNCDGERFNEKRSIWGFT
jgi:hypothetical protein